MTFSYVTRGIIDLDPVNYLWNEFLQSDNPTIVQYYVIQYLLQLQKTNQKYLSYTKTYKRYSNKF